MWRASRYLLTRTHVQAYFKLADPTEPSEDQDDRHALYAMQVDTFFASQTVGLTFSQAVRLVGIYLLAGQQKDERAVRFQSCGQVCRRKLTPRCAQCQARDEATRWQIRRWVRGIPCFEEARGGDRKRKGTAVGLCRRGNSRTRIRSFYLVGNKMYLG